MNGSTDSTTMPTPSIEILAFTIAGYVVFGVLGVLGSMTTVIVIAASKKLHTPCFILIAAGCVGSFLVAAHYFSRGIDKLGLDLGVFHFERTGLQCLLITGVMGLFGIMFHSQIICFVAADRLASLIVPNRYRLWGKGYALWIIGGCSTFAIAFEVVGFVTAPLDSRVLCTEFMDAQNVIYVKTYGILSSSCNVCTVIAYGVMWLCFRFRHNFTGEGSLNQDAFIKQQMAVMPTITLMALLYLFTGALAEIFVNAGMANPPGQTQFFLISLGTVLKTASSLVEVVALVARNKNFRQCCKTLMGTENTQVAPTVSSGRLVMSSSVRTTNRQQTCSNAGDRRHCRTGHN